MTRSPFLAWSGSLALGLALPGCYQHHTADELVLAPADAGVAANVDRCAEVDEDDVATQMACDPEWAEIAREHLRDD